MKKILVVDDDLSLRTILNETLSTSGFNVEIAKDAKAALELLSENQFDLVISDLMMPGMTGVEFMVAARNIYENLGFLIITAYGTVETAVDALHKGAFDFITKPFSISQIESRVTRYFDYQELKAENKALKRKLSDDRKYTKLVGQSPEMERVFSQISIVARSDAAVFIQGESGTGKELIAQSIHEGSDRSDKPFLKINCSAIPESLFESTLFGHEKGSFTNAIKMHKGLFEEADGGTLLLDEISEIPTTMQAKLLRVLQNRTITRVGNTQELDVDVRVIATSNQDIDKLIKEGYFRSDLYYRLNVFPIIVPPLRMRNSDIPLLIDHFLGKFKIKYRFEHKEVSAETLKLISKEDWPGNVRQLENIIERAVLYSGEDERIAIEHFNLEAEILKADDASSIKAVTTIAEMEKQMIHNALKRTTNNRTQAADLLGISVRTLRNKLHLYDEMGKGMLKYE
ncbi:MAG: sigma-54 dependent transcriptional regulator [Candidatus Marinimicrobia bacterium]|nr:sigma-54 dependent transcriptional regulator [Candidatus Neomarinimicrobiota bacterium]